MAKKNSQSSNNSKGSSSGSNSKVKSSNIGTYKRSDTSKSTGSGTGPKKTE